MWTDLALLALGRRRRFRITGRSMEPTYRDGETVLVDPRAYRRRTPAPGDVVLVRHPFRTGVRMVKRVHAVRGDGRLDLRGDNAGESSDSRSFGTILVESVEGRVVRTWP